MKSQRRAAGFLGITVVILGLTIGCPLAVTDDYTIVQDGVTPSSSSGVNPGNDDMDGCAPGFACVPVIEAGTFVHVELTNRVECPSGWASPVAYTDGTDPGCSCACSPAEGGDCQPGKITEYESGMCAVGDDKKDHSPMADGSCVDITTGASGIKVVKSSPSPGACEPVAYTPPPLSLQLCSPAAASLTSCAEGKVCVPDMSGPAARICNLIEGAMCAPGWELYKSVFPMVEDTRSCDCSCDAAPPGTCAGASAELYSGKGCVTSMGASFSATNECFDATTLDTHGSIKVNAGAWTGGKCEAISTITGDFGLDEAAIGTLCCLP
jgi:hypothetical protein